MVSHQLIIRFCVNKIKLVERYTSGDTVTQRQLASFSAARQSRKKR